MIHEASRTPPEEAAVALAHFKFYPGIDAKLQQALERQEYCRGALEYRILKLAFQRMGHTPLSSATSRRWRGATSLEQAGLLTTPPEDSPTAPTDPG